MSGQKNKVFLIFILIFSSLILFSAYIIEYKLGHAACKLCLYERVPYFISILLIFVIFFINKYEKIILLILSFTFFVGAAIAFYHFGIEQGFFDESLVCVTENFAETLSKEQLLEQLKQNSISCRNVSFRILGFSLATINSICSIILSVIFMKLYMDYGKN